MQVSLQFIMMLAVLIAIALILPWVVRWLSRRRGLIVHRQKSFIIHDVFALDPKKKLYVFDFEQVRYLVILGPDGDTLVDVRPLAPVAPEHDEDHHPAWVEPRL